MHLCEGRVAPQYTLLLVSAVNAVFITCSMPTIKLDSKNSGPGTKQKIAKVFKLCCELTLLKAAATFLGLCSTSQ